MEFGESAPHDQTFIDKHCDTLKGSFFGGKFHKTFPTL